jgi:hypothetical protein
MIVEEFSAAKQLWASSVDARKRCVIIAPLLPAERSRVGIPM